jgi:hypothetical protein
MNSILSFSKDTAVYVDPLGLITTDFCMANTEVLAGFGNLFDGPEFFNSYAHDFRLKSTSSAIDMGNQLTELDPDGTRADMGAIPYTPLSNEVVTAGIVITEVHYNPSPLQGTDDDFEFVELYNPGEEPVDLEGYSFVVGIQYTFPEGSVIGPHQYILVAKNSLTYVGNGYSVFQWETGKLDNGGELLVLLDDEGFAVDMVQYGTGDPWPVQPDGGGSSLMILDPELSNATARNWVSGTGLGGTPGLANWGGVGGIRLLTNPLRIETSWTALPGIVYQLEYRDSLSSGNWVPVGESIMATAGQVIFADELPVLSNENGKQGFYRVRIILPSESE